MVGRADVARDGCGRLLDERSVAAVTERLRGRGNGVYEADVRYPKEGRGTTGAVSVKAEAWDVAGNRVEQTVTRAFGLREGGGDDDSHSDD
jgi:hypothetical protein